MWSLQPDMLRCRVRATEAVGVIVAAVGMEALGPSVQDYVAAALRVGEHLFPLPSSHSRAPNCCLGRSDWFLHATYSPQIP